MGLTGPGPSRVRVVHLLNTLDPAGVERSVLELTGHLEAARFRNEVWYVTGRGRLAPLFAAANITVRKIPLLFGRDPSIVPRLTYLLRRHHTDILHTHHPEATAYGRLAAGNAGLKGVITTEHTVLNWSNPGLFTNRLIRTTAGRADRVVSVSRAVEYLARGAGAVPAGRSEIIHDGVSLPPEDNALERRRAARRRFGIPAEGPLVATLGRLEPHKGLKGFLETVPLILSERADAWFAIPGEGSMKEALEKQARELEVHDRVFFPGPIEDPYEFLPGVDLFLLPSLTEGYGIAALEAMAHGIPVVATYVGGIPELLEQGNGGLLVNVNAPREMAAVALYFLNSALYSAEIGGTGRRRVAAEASASRMAEAYAAVYEDVLAGGGAGAGALARPPGPLPPGETDL